MESSNEILGAFKKANNQIDKLQKQMNQNDVMMKNAIRFWQERIKNWLKQCRKRQEIKTKKKAKLKEKDEKNQIATNTKQQCIGRMEPWMWKIKKRNKEKELTIAELQGFITHQTGTVT